MLIEAGVAPGILAAAAAGSEALSVALLLVVGVVATEKTPLLLRAYAAHARMALAGL